MEEDEQMLLLLQHGGVNDLAGHVRSTGLEFDTCA